MTISYLIKMQESEYWHFFGKRDYYGKSYKMTWDAVKCYFSRFWWYPHNNHFMLCQWAGCFCELDFSKCVIHFTYLKFKASLYFFSQMPLELRIGLWMVYTHHGKNEQAYIKEECGIKLKSPLCYLIGRQESK